MNQNSRKKPLSEVLASPSVQTDVKIKPSLTMCLFLLPYSSQTAWIPYFALSLCMNYFSYLFFLDVSQLAKWGLGFDALAVSSQPAASNQRHSLFSTIAGYASTTDTLLTYARITTGDSCPFSGGPHVITPSEGTINPTFLSVFWSTITFISRTLLLNCITAMGHSTAPTGQIH